MVACFVVAVIGLRSERAAACSRVRGNRVPLRPLAAWLAFVLLATVHAAFLSQQLWGSTYALWPVLMVLIACSLSTLSNFGRQATTTLEQKKLERGTQAFTPTFAAVVANTLIIAGAFYIRSEERLSYVNTEDGPVMHSSIPTLRGIATRGAFLPNFEELVRYTDREIPRHDGIIMLPGEDLFYFTTGREPQFPAIMFDHTVNPYNSGEELAAAVRARSNIRWMIVKRELQLQEHPMPLQRVVDLLEPDFQLVEKLDNYDVYRRK
jgi:hypothetical protein